MHYSVPCAECEFELWLPVCSNDVIQVGLYDDGRFPGRLLVMLTDHYDHLEDVPAELAARFTWSLQRVSASMKRTLAVDRINLAILGNAVPHVHAHLIPRRATDPLPHKSPWEDPRPRTVLPPGAEKELLTKLRTEIEL